MANQDDKQKPVAQEAKPERLTKKRITVNFFKIYVPT